jgi:hypothetical protein
MNWHSCMHVCVCMYVFLCVCCTMHLCVCEDGCLLGCCDLMMEAVSASETSVSTYQTKQRNIPEDSHLHTRRRKNLKSHLFICVLFNDAVSSSDYIESNVRIIT